MRLNCLIDSFELLYTIGLNPICFIFYFINITIIPHLSSLELYHQSTIFFFYYKNKGYSVLLQRSPSVFTSKSSTALGSAVWVKTRRRSTQNNIRVRNAILYKKKIVLHFFLFIRFT